MTGGKKIMEKILFSKNTLLLTLSLFALVTIAAPSSAHALSDPGNHADSRPDGAGGCGAQNPNSGGGGGGGGNGSPSNQSPGCQNCGGQSCFIAGTKVTLEDGTKQNIEEVEVGDVVIGRNGSKNRVVALDRPLLEERQLYSINGGPYFFTHEHPFRVIDGWKLVWKSINPEASKRENPTLPVYPLKVGDLLVTDSGVVKIYSLTSKDAPDDLPLYNLLLDRDNTYFADGYLVHNAGGGDGAGSSANQYQSPGGGGKNRPRYNTPNPNPYSSPYAYPTPPTLQFQSLSCSSGEIYLGEQVHILWSCNPAGSCTANFNLSGGSPTTVTPANGGQNTYWIENQYDTRAQCTVNVIVPDLELTATPKSVLKGGSSTLSWSGDDVQSCTLQGPLLSGEVACANEAACSTIHEATTGALLGEATYTLSCEHPGGTAEATATVRIQPEFEEE